MDEIDQEMNANAKEQESIGTNKHQPSTTVDEPLKKKKIKSPLLAALKKVDNEEKKKRKELTHCREGKKSNPDKKRKTEDANSVAPSQKDFIQAKKYQGSRSGYVFRMGKSGLGYYKDVKPVVDRLAMEAIKRMGKGSGKKGGRSRRSY